ncbi:MAG TPA: TetR/AcrR family transcriptional regulator C-terminal domain-containing protein [Mesorhizobium sp.]|jgi:AcrR family transcriptional regulator|nr:TetR/AcrR family transcriptional regulator C-terminal domain-containing protein [Mesorhizobium sp.]
MEEEAASAFSPRQREVLDASLAVLVEKGEALTMTAVAARASCSKETLYKWFGGRDGLLEATVRWQASKVRVSVPEGGAIDMNGLTEALTRFAADWLRVVSSSTSIALNRLAIGQAGQKADAGKGLGAVVLANGRFALGLRLKPLLEAAGEAGLIAFDDAEAAFRTFFGLVARDVQIRLLLGDELKLTANAIAGDAARATRQFIQLHQTDASGDPQH